MVDIYQKRYEEITDGLDENNDEKFNELDLKELSERYENLTYFLQTKINDLEQF